MHDVVTDSDPSLVAVRSVLLRSAYCHKNILLSIAVAMASRPGSQPLGGSCDRWRYSKLWEDLFGVHLPFTMDDHGHGLVPQYRMDDVDVIDAKGLYRPVYKLHPTRGEIGASLSHSKAWLLAHSRRRPLVVLEDDVAVSAQFLEQMSRFVATPPNAGWDMLHFGVVSTPRASLAVPHQY